MQIPLTGKGASYVDQTELATCSVHRRISALPRVQADVTVFAEDKQKLLSITIMEVRPSWFGVASSRTG